MNKRFLSVLWALLLTAGLGAAAAAASDEPASSEPVTEFSAEPAVTAEPEVTMEPVDGPAAAAVKDGLAKDAAGRVYFYENGRMKTGLQTVDGIRYYFSVRDGHRMMGGFVSDGKYRYYASAKDGHIMRNGFVAVKGERYYLAPGDGHVMKGGFINVLGRRYYLDSKDGHVRSGESVTVGGQRFYLSAEDGRCLTGCVIEDGGRPYYLAASDGHVMKNGWIRAASGQYYAEADGALLTGRASVDGAVYIFDDQNGRLVEGPVNRLPLENQDAVHRLSQESRGSCLATSYSMAANLVLGWDKYGAFDWCVSDSNDAANIAGSLQGSDGRTYSPVVGGMTYDALVKGIDEALAGGWPIVVSVQGSSTASTHYVLLVGYADSEHSDYLIVDPAGGGDASIAESAVAMRDYRRYELGNRNGTYMYVSFKRT